MLLALSLGDGGLLTPQGEDQGNVSCREKQRPFIAQAGWKTPCWICLACLPKRLASKVRPQDKFVATALLSTTFNRRRTQVWGPRIINSLAAGRKKRTVVLRLPLVPEVPPNVPASWTWPRDTTHKTGTRQHCLTAKAPVPTQARRQ